MPATIQASARTEQPGGFATIPRALLYDKTISQSAKVVYLALSSRVNASLQCWPSQERIADDVGLSLATVKRSLQELAKHGHVTWRIRATAAGRSSNVYTLGNPTAQIELLGDPTAQSDVPTAQKGSSQQLTSELQGGEPTAQIELNHQLTSELQNESHLEREPVEETSLRSAQTPQTLVAEWVDHCNGSRPPGRVIGQIAKEIGAMLNEGIPYADVRAGLQQWQLRGLHPSVLASVVHEMRTARSGGLKSRRQLETDSQFERMMAIAAERDAQLNLTTDSPKELMT
jgi:hypothetical protein